MRTLKKNIRNTIDWENYDEIQFALILLVIITAFCVFCIFMFLEHVLNLSDIENNIIISLPTGITIPVLFIIIDKYRKRNGPLYSKADKAIFNIVFLFIKSKNLEQKKSLDILLKLFSSYSPVQTGKIFYDIQNKSPDLNSNCKIISQENSETKFFLLYTLMDFSAADNLYSLKEEEFIDNIRKKIKIHIQTFNKIKKSYLRKGLKDERKIIEEQKREKLISQFSRIMLPYEAYRIMGVSPSVTKLQLKKAYRNLAKKHHPDKFAGQSEEIIKNAEEKFQEIKEAYDLILKKI